MSQRNTLSTTLALATAALALAAATLAHAGDSGFSMGVEGHGHTTAADVSLPVYAGAVPYQDSDNDKAAVTLGAWAGKFGLHIDALKFRAAAPADRVAAFYAKALGRFGTVLDCRDPANRVKQPKDSDKLSCEERAPRAGEFEYRVGTAKNFRAVSVRPDGEGSRFDIARIELSF